MAAARRWFSTTPFQVTARANYEIVRDLESRARTFGSLTEMKRNISLSAIDLRGF
jgi:hypothetical protein